MKTKHPKLMKALNFLEDEEYQEFYNAKCKCQTFEYFKKNHGNCPGEIEKLVTQLKK